MKITVIVAAYNTEKYISECVDSVLIDNSNDIELIVINDGSTDATGSILDKVSDQRLKVLHTKNSGQSVARNAGLSIATGEYIMFLDSDDKLEKGAISRISSIIEKQKPDIIMFESKVFFEDDDLAYRFNPKYERNANLCDKLTSGVEFFKSAVNAGNYIVNPCLYISSRKALNNVTFNDGIIHEDNIFTTMLLLENEVTVYCINEKLHLRRIRHGSVMTQRKGDAHLKGYYACIQELANNRPKNFPLVTKEYGKFLAHMVECFKCTNNDIISDLNNELSKSKSKDNEEINRLKNEIFELKNSTSWRITSPLRKMMSLIKK
ncbi:glycosyltransferase family 2 protein [Serratia marcescens]